jgi:hypothetical protein
LKQTMFILAVALVFASLAMGEELRPLGGKVHDPSLGHQELIIPRFPEGVRALPSSVDLTADMPPVGSQVGNSCTGWSVGYYFKTHQERVEHGWDLSDPGHQFSPAFIYNQLNEGVDGGVDLFDALELMWAHGCATVSQMPTNSGYTVWPSETAFDSALFYRCEQSASPWFYFGSDAGIEAAKQLLSENKCVVFNISVFHNFDVINTYDTTYCAADSSGTNRGGHNLCIVGYDDNKATHDGTGAFRCINSWGTGWGNKGYWWLSYQIIRDHHQMVYPWAGYAPDRNAYQPSLKARVQVSHNRRGRTEFIAGIGDPAAPLWSKTFYVVGNGTGEYWSTGGDLPFPGSNMVLDLSEGIPFLDSTVPNNIFTGCIDTYSDGVSGQIEYLSAEYAGWGASAVSVETPKAIPDFNTYAYCSVQLSKPAGVTAPEQLNASVLSHKLSLAVSPNPAQDRCLISANSPLNASAQLSIYDAAGRLVRRLDQRSPGAAFFWDLRNGSNQRVTSGIYLVRLTSGDLTAVDRVLVVR